MPADLTSELRGPRGVRHDIVEFFRAQLPSHAAACRAAWGLDDDDLPLPASVPGDARADGYFPREPAAVDRWPLLAVTSGRRTQRAIDFDPDDGAAVFRVTYPVRVYSWVKAEGFDTTQDMRDDLASAVLVTVASHNYLGTTGRLQVVPSTLVVDYSSVVAVKGDRFVGGSYVGFDVNATETLTDRLALPDGQPRDTVSGVTATGDPLPHPALQ